MHVRSFIVSAAALVLAAAVLALGRFAAPAVAVEPPVILLVTIDALRADHLGVYGYARPTSPRIDTFARDAVVIETAIAQAPYTKALVASLMTGLYPSAHKTFTVSATFDDAIDGRIDGAFATTDVLSAGLTTLAEALKARGYETAAFTTNPFLIRDFGFAQGFDRFEFLGRQRFAAARDVLARALHVIAARKGPLFLWAHLMEPHSPYAPGETFAGELPQVMPPRPIADWFVVPDYLAAGRSRDARFYEALYDREIRDVDAAFGDFVAGLQQTPAWADTILVLTSDHGEEFFEHGGLEHNMSLYDELIRVPLIMRIPGMAPRFVPAQAQLVDVLPTLVALAGAKAVRGVHGHDVRPLLRGETLDGGSGYAEVVGQQYAVRTGEWKLIAGPGRARELYALARDPGEEYNLAVAHPRQLAAMEQLLQRTIASALNAGKGISSATAPVDAATRQRLEALGYVQR